MAKQDIGLGTLANDGTGDTLRTGGDKVNDNFGEVYTYLGDGTTLSSDPVVTEAATQTLTNKSLTSPTITGTGAIAGTFTGDVTGNVTGDVTGNVTGDVTGNLTGNLTGNVTGNVSTSSGNLQLDANSQIVEVRGGGSNSGAITLNCEVNTHGQKIIAQPHSASVTNTLTLPAGANSTLISEATLASNLPNESYSKFGTSTSPNLGLAQVTVGNFFLDEGGVNEVETSFTVSGGRTTALVILNANVMNVTDGTTEGLVEIERSTDGFATAGTKIGSFIFPVANTFYGSQHFSLLDTHGASDGDTVTYRLKNGNSVANSYSDESLRLVTGTCGDTIGVREI